MCFVPFVQGGDRVRTEMAKRRSEQRRGTREAPRWSHAAAGSWAALVAATTLGLGATAPLRAQVRAGAALVGDGAYRLVVQSYEEESLRGGGLPVEGARPLGSMQREVTAEELRRGVPVTVLELEPAPSGRSVLVAWAERATLDQEVGGFMARPGRDAHVGVARPRADSGRAAVLLKPAG